MDRAMVRDHLAKAEGHVDLGHRHVARQREIVAELERDGHDVRDAKRLLETFEKLLKMHIADRDRLRRELGPD